MASPNDCDLMQAVITCEGDLHDPEFHLKFGRFLRKLKSVLCPVDKQRKLRVRRVEPWNSVRVTFTLPREAAVRLRQLAQVGDEVLRELGVLSVQLEGDQVISLTIAGRFNEPQEIAFRTDPVGRSAVPPAPECTTVGGAVPAKLSSTAPAPEMAQNKHVMEILSQAVGVLTAAPSTAPAGSSDTPVSLPPSSSDTNGVNPKPLAAPPLGFLSPNVVAPHHQPVPFVPPTPAPATHRPLTNTYPFASMVHAAQTAQGASHAPGARLPLAASPRVRTNSPLTFSAPASDASTLPTPAPTRGVVPGAAPKLVERNSLSNSLLVNLLQCEQNLVTKPLPPPPTGASLPPPKSLAPPGAPPPPTSVTDASNMTLAASVTVVNVRTGVAIPNLSNLANGGPLADAPPLSAPPSLSSAPSSPQFAKIDKKAMVHSSGGKAKPSSPAPSSPSSVAAPAATPKSLPYIPGGATVTAVTHLNPPPPSAPPPLHTTGTGNSAPPMGAPTNLLDGMVCVNDTYMLPGRNNLSITVVSDRNRLGPLVANANPTSTSTSRNTPPPLPPPAVVTTTAATVLHPSLQPAKGVESTGKSSNVPVWFENELLEGPDSATPSAPSENEELSLAVGGGPPPSDSITSAAAAGGVLDAEKSTSGAERIKLRLRLEKSEPVVALAAYKVEKTCSGPVSFLRKSTGTLVNAVPAAKVTALPVVAGCNASPLPSGELRVPPLHISLKGRNATLLSPPARSLTAGGGANAKEDTSEDESGKFASKRKPKSKDTSEPRKPFKRKRSLPLIESDPEEEEAEPKSSLGEELRVAGDETSTDPTEINAKVPRLTHDSDKPTSCPEKLNCATPSLVPPELKKARLAPEITPPEMPTCTEAPLVANSVLVTSPIVPVDQDSPEDKVQDVELTKRTASNATLPLITRTVHLNHVKIKEEPLLKVSVLNNVQKQVHNSLLHRGLELSPLEAEKEEKNGGAKDLQAQAPPPVALEAAGCKDEPVNTQGEDSGIESMDALSEKSPNQSESPSRREDRPEPELLPTAPSLSHAYVELPHRPNPLPSPPASTAEEAPVPSSVEEKAEPKEEEEAAQASIDHASVETKPVVMVNGTSGRSSASTSPCPEEKEVTVAPPPKEISQENYLASPQEACLECEPSPDAEMGNKVKQEGPVATVEALETMVTSPPTSPASPSRSKRRRSESPSPEPVRTPVTADESASTVADTPMEEEERAETCTKTPPLPLEAPELAEMDVSEDQPASMGPTPDAEVPAGTNESSTSGNTDGPEETSPIPVPLLPPPTPPEKERPAAASPAVSASDSPAPPTPVAPVLVPATLPCPVTAVLVTSSSSTELSDAACAVVTPPLPSGTLSVPAPSPEACVAGLAVTPTPSDVESSHSIPPAPRPALVIPTVASVPPSPPAVPSPPPRVATPTLEPAPSLAEHAETAAELIPEQAEPALEDSCPPDGTPDANEPLERRETTDTPLEGGASPPDSPVAAGVVKDECLGMEEDSERVTEAPPPVPNVEETVALSEDWTMEEEKEDKVLETEEVMKVEPLEESEVPKCEIVDETLTPMEAEIKEEPPASPVVAPPPVPQASAPESVSSDISEVTEVREPKGEEGSVRTEAPPLPESLDVKEEGPESASVTVQTFPASDDSVTVDEATETRARTIEAPPSEDRTVTPVQEGVSLATEEVLVMNSESGKPGEEEEGEELVGTELSVSLEEGGGAGGSVSASGPNSPFHGFCDKEMVVPPVVEVVGGDTPPSVEPSESLLLSGANTPSEESLEATTLASVTKVEGEHEEGKLVTEQLRIEIPDVVTRCTRSGTRVISPDASARTDRRSPRQASPIVVPVGGGLDEKLAKRGVRRKRQESESSNASQGRNTPDADDLSVTSRPSKRKCSENATELIKACMGLEDPPKRVAVAPTTTTNSADQTPPPPANSVKRNSKGGLEEDPVTKLSVNSEEEDNHLSDDEPLSELAHRAVRQALKDRTTRIRGSNVKRGGAKTFKERGAGGRRNSTDSPSGLNNSRSVTPTRRSGRALVGIKVATPTVLGAEATDLPTRRKTRSSCVTVPDGDGSQPANRRRPVSKDRR